MTDLDEAYAWPDPRLGGSVHVRVNFVTSLDGAVDFRGSARPLSSKADNAVYSTLRGLCDVILVGAGTVRAAGYGPAQPSAERRSRRLARGQQAVPPIAVVSSRLQLDPSSAFFAEASARPLVMTTEAAYSTLGPQVAALAKVAEVVQAGSITVDPHRALAALAERGLVRVLCEGGPTLAGGLAAADVIDELCLSLSSILVGSAESRILSGPPAQGPWPLRMELNQVLCAESMLFTCYRRAAVQRSTVRP